MTTNELFLYACDRLKKEWYETPDCDQMRQAFEHFKEEYSNIIIDCINQAYMDIIYKVLTEGSEHHADE